MLGKLEELCLLQLAVKGPRQKAGVIQQGLVRHSPDLTTFSNVHTALTRLVAKGFVVREDAVEAERKTVYFSLTSDGRAALDMNVRATEPLIRAYRFLANVNSARGQI